MTASFPFQSLFRIALGVCLALAMSLGVSSIAQAQSARDRARMSFDRGVKLYEARQYSEALTAFQEAYRIKPHPSVRLNMASCYENLNKPAEAAEHFEKYLSQSASIPRKKRRSLRRKIRALHASIGTLTLRVSPLSAQPQVQIGGEPNADSMIGQDIRLGAGKHEIVVTAEGYSTEKREVAIARGRSHLVSITLTPVAAPVEPNEGMEDQALEADQVESDGGLQLTPPVLVSGGVTLGLLLTATVTGVLAMGADSDFEDSVTASRDMSLSAAERNDAVLDGRDASNRADALALVTDLLLVGAAAGAGVTAFFLFSQDGGEQERSDSNDLRVEAAPYLGVGEAGLRMRGRF